MRYSSGMPMFALILLLALTQQTPDEVMISSNSPQVKEGEIAHFKDKVVATYQDMHFEADFADWNDSTKQLIAGEHVLYTRGEEKLEGAKLDFNLHTKWDPLESTCRHASLSIL